MKKFFKELGDKLKSAFKGFLGLFSETSPTSLMRFMSFFMFWFSLYETHYIISNYGKDLTWEQITLICIFYTFAFFPKVAQKVIEKKYNLLEKQLKEKNL